MSTPPRERTIEGLCLKATPLGEQDRLLLLLTEEEGLLKLAASGARKPRSSLAAAGFQKRHAGIKGHLHQRLQLITAELVGLKDQFQRQAQLHHRRNLIVQGRELAIEQQGEVGH